MNDCIMRVLISINISEFFFKFQKNYNNKKVIVDIIQIILEKKTTKKKRLFENYYYKLYIKSSLSYLYM